MNERVQLGQLSQPLSHSSKRPNAREAAGTAKAELKQWFNPSVPVSRSLGPGQRDIAEFERKTMRSYASNELIWRGDRLALNGGRRGFPAVEIVPDDSCPGMWRVGKQDGSLSDMVNRTRARDGARSILLGILNGQETASEPAQAFCSVGAE